jgi:putative PIN family toxin of toxin-antitoxin system
LRGVFDTNVLVSALLLPDSIPRHAFELAFRKGRVLLSLATLAELSTVLSRKKFIKYINEEDIRSFVAALTREAEWVEVDVRIAACRDPKDNKFLELAVSGQGTHIISGDFDLLAQNPFQGIEILTPHQFLQTPAGGELLLEFFAGGGLFLVLEFEDVGAGVG